MPYLKLCFSSISEYVREEIVAVIALNFNSYFNQLALEVGIHSAYTTFQLISVKTVKWGKINNFTKLMI